MGSLNGNVITADMLGQLGHHNRYVKGYLGCVYQNYWQSNPPKIGKGPALFVRKLFIRLNPNPYNSASPQRSPGAATVCPVTSTPRTDKDENGLLDRDVFSGLVSGAGKLQSWWLPGGLPLGYDIPGTWWRVWSAYATSFSRIAHRSLITLWPAQSPSHPMCPPTPDAS